MSLSIDLLTPDSCSGIPEESQFSAWANAALLAADYTACAEISFSVIPADEMAELNNTYRQKNTPTNVLSFPAELHEAIDVPLLGDIAFCQEIIEQEALTQKKMLDAHWAHMTVHGVLHLLGYDHIDEADADIMENLEIQTLKQLGYNNPYVIEEH